MFKLTAKVRLGFSFAAVTLEAASLRRLLWCGSEGLPAPDAALWVVARLQF